MGAVSCLDCQACVQLVVEQMNSWEGEVNICTKKETLGGSGPRKIFKFACSEIESGAIWSYLKPSTHISEVE